MIVTKEIVLKGCLIASLSHAIMTNIYPEFSYEQSWDGINYSIQDSQGLRGTITFVDDYCVGAIRNEIAVNFDKANFATEIFRFFPQKIIDVAEQETLQYLLIRKNGSVFPFATSVFWADNNGFHFVEENLKYLQQDITLFRKIFLTTDDAVKEWQLYYDMDNNAVKLLKYLFSEKVKSLNQKIVLDETKIKLIPGNEILSECIDSLRELNIILK